MIILLIFLFIFGIFLYFLPTKIASRKRSTNAGAVFVINLFLGRTIIGWFIALLMAYMGEEDIK